MAKREIIKKRTVSDCQGNFNTVAVRGQTKEDLQIGTWES